MKIKQFYDGRFGRREGMMKAATKVKFTIFQYLIVACTAGVILGSAEGYSQDRDQFQWSKSAGSLTIFQPGDAVRIRVYELGKEERKNFNLNQDYPINPEGYIVLPIIGEVRVKGLTVHELMQVLQQKFREWLMSPHVEVRPLIRLTMQGAFNRPGVYYADPTSSLWDAVAQADGPDRDCDLKRMRVERGGDVVMPNVLESFEKGYSLEEIGIESGDQIVAPSRGGLDMRFLVTLVNLFASIVLLYLRLRTGQW
jgi:polysaccharide export outer membrane protein